MASTSRPYLRAVEDSLGESDDDIALGVDVVVKRAMARLGTPLGHVAQALLGVGTAKLGAKAKLRREDAAARWGGDGTGVGEDYFRKKLEDGLLTDVALEIYRQETQLIRRANSGDTETEPRPIPVELGDLTLDRMIRERYDHYYRIWSSISGLTHDLQALVGIRQGGEVASWQNEGDYLNLSLYHYTRYQIALHNFVEDFGGLWLLPDADDEMRLANAVYRISWHSPYSELEDSRLRSVLGVMTRYEADAFIWYLESTEPGNVLLKKWKLWAESCSCEAREATDERCQVHQMIEQCVLYEGIIDKCWNVIVNTEREPARVEPDDPADLFERFWGDVPPPPWTNVENSDSDD